MKPKHIRECRLAITLPGYNENRVITRDEQTKISLEYEDGLLKITKDTDVIFVPVQHVEFMREK